MEYFDPWRKIANNLGTIAQLRLEISEQHIMFGREVELIASRRDCDDMLFKVFNADFEFAVIHLTWSSKKHIDSVYPSTDIYKNWEDFSINRMLPDHEEAKFEE